MKLSLRRWALLGLIAFIGALAFAAFLFVFDLLLHDDAIRTVSPEALREAKLLREFEHELVGRLRPFEERRPKENDTHALGFEREARTTLSAQINQTRQRLFHAQLHESVISPMLRATDRLVALSKDPYNEQTLRRAREAVRQSIQVAEERIDALGAKELLQTRAAVVR